MSLCSMSWRPSGLELFKVGGALPTTDHLKVPIFLVITHTYSNNEYGGYLSTNLCSLCFSTVSAPSRNGEAPKGQKSVKLIIYSVELTALIRWTGTKGCLINLFTAIISSGMMVRLSGQVIYTLVSYYG